MSNTETKPAKLRLKKIHALEYKGTLGAEPVTVGFSTGCNEGWSIEIRGQWHWLATNFKTARTEAVRRFGSEVAS